MQPGKKIRKLQETDGLTSVFFESMSELGNPTIIRENRVSVVDNVLVGEQDLMDDSDIIHN